MLRTQGCEARVQLAIGGLISGLLMPTIALAARDSPFARGLSSLQADAYSWLTPIAVIAIIILGGLALFGQVTWGACLKVILGIAIGFGAVQILIWVRTGFGV